MNSVTQTSKQNIWMPSARRFQMREEPADAEKLLEDSSTPLSDVKMDEKKMSMLSIKEEHEESVLEIEPDDDEDGDRLKQLKRYILDLARSGPSVYQSLDKHRESTRALNLPEETGSHHHKIRNAFAVIAVEEATAKLEQILALPPLWPLWAQVCISGVASGGICGMFFHGDWDDMLVGAVLGASVSGIGKIIQRPFDKTFEFVAAVLVSTIVRSLIYFGWPICYTAATISAVLPLLQGTSLTMSMVELATRNVVPGTTRLFGALTMTTLIGFGLEFGLEVTSSILKVQKRPGEIADPNSVAIFVPNTCKAIDPTWNWLLFPVTATALCLSLNAHVRQLPGMLVAQVIAFVVSNFITSTLNKQISVAFSAFCCGAFANIYARMRGVPAMVPTYAGMLMLVPGSMALRSITELLGSDPTSGVSLVMSVLSIALSIGLGLFLAATAVVPIQDWADHLKGKHRRVDDLENLIF
ncbi:hypothetical protein HDU98_011500 [Podochytrium sp. JEL0797]|nr:hypothetical protein HDU98_011500 [Podochytrium sp. JEL0797]